MTKHRYEVRAIPTIDNHGEEISFDYIGKSFIDVYTELTNHYKFSIQKIDKKEQVHANTPLGIFGDVKLRRF